MRCICLLIAELGPQCHYKGLEWRTLPCAQKKVMATLNVVSYHINVGVGDCAVHQLRSITGNEITVVSSVLVDGGSTEALKISGDTVTYLTGEVEKNGVTRAIRYFDSRQNWKWANDSGKFLFDTIGKLGYCGVVSIIPFAKYDTVCT